MRLTAIHVLRALLLYVMLVGTAGALVAAGARVDSKQQKERCGKVDGEVAYKTALALNEYFDGKWTPPAWKPSAETQHCVMCHGPDNMQHTSTAMNQQQGHMECVMCHDDHTQ